MRKTLLVAVLCLVTCVVFAQIAKPQSLVQTLKILPLNIKTGLWQFNANITTTGNPPIPSDKQAQLNQLPPDQRAQATANINKQFASLTAPRATNYKRCITAENVNSWLSDPNARKCAWTVINSTSSETELRGVCDSDIDKYQGMKTEVSTKMRALDSENVNGLSLATMTGNGQTLLKTKFAITGKWLSATCPAAAD